MRALIFILLLLAYQNASGGENASVGEKRSLEGDVTPNSATVQIEIPLTGEAIMQSAFDRDDGADSYAKIEMVLTDKTGSQRKRVVEIYRKDYGALIKTFLKFKEPADIKNTGFLSWENGGMEDTQYLYLPELGRVRRIVSTQKNVRFVNTDFTYEDMQRRWPQKDTHTLLGEETVDGKACFVVESMPRDIPQYSKRVSWVNKDSRVIVRVDLYNKKGEKAKVFKAERLEKQGEIWTPMLTVMDDLKENHKTSMRVLEVRYNQGLDDALFTKENMEKK